jgi:hypothetical protein
MLHKRLDAFVPTEASSAGVFERGLDASQGSILLCGAGIHDLINHSKAQSKLLFMALLFGSICQ